MSDYMVTFVDKWGNARNGVRTTKSIARGTARMLKADGCTEVAVVRCKSHLTVVH